MKKTYTLREAAEVLGLAPGTLRVQVHNGRLKATKVDGIVPHWVITDKEVLRYGKESRRGSIANAR
jgi:excisionase family DNA binding protein